MKYIYVDYENLNSLQWLPKTEGKYFFFIGETQAKISSALVLSTNGMAVDWIKVKGSGKNALDFHIAYYLAKNDREKGVEHLILSKDTGFDPLIVHLCEQGIAVRRIITVDEIDDAKAFKALENYDAVYKNLSKIPKTSRPKSIKSLTSHIKAMLKNASDKEVQLIVDELFRQGFTSSSDNSRLKYTD